MTTSLPPRHGRKWIGRLASIALGAGLLAALMSQIDPGKLGALLIHADPGWTALAVASFLFYQWIRSQRVSGLLAAPPSLRRLFPDLCLQAILNRVLPLWLGEAGMVWFLRRHGADTAEAMAVTVATRGMELVLLAAGFVLAGAMVGDRLPESWRWLPAAVAVALTVGLVAAKPVMRRLERHFGCARHAALRSPQRLGHGLLLTLAMLTALIGQHYSCLRALGSDLGWWDVVLMFFITFPVSLLPLKTPGSLGIFEASWWFALNQVFLVPSERAIMLGIGGHAIVLLSFAAGGVVWLLRGLVREAAP